MLGTKTPLFSHLLWLATTSYASLLPAPTPPPLPLNLTYIHLPLSFPITGNTVLGHSHLPTYYLLSLTPSSVAPTHSDARAQLYAFHETDRATPASGFVTSPTLPPAILRPVSTTYDPVITSNFHTLDARCDTRQQGLSP